MSVMLRAKCGMRLSSGADANEVWKSCEAMLERDVSIDGVYAVEKFF